MVKYFSYLALKTHKRKTKYWETYENEKQLTSSGNRQESLRLCCWSISKLKSFFFQVTALYFLVFLQNSSSIETLTKVSFNPEIFCWKGSRKQLLSEYSHILFYHIFSKITKESLWIWLTDPFKVPLHFWFLKVQNNQSMNVF